MAWHGVAWREPFLAIPAESWDRMLAVNLRGMFLVAQAAAHYLVEQGSGEVITNMASTNGLAGEVDFTHDNAPKGGVVLLSTTMALELAQYGIRVKPRCPGSIATGKDTPTEFHVAYAATRSRWGGAARRRRWQQLRPSFLRRMSPSSRDPSWWSTAASWL